MTEGGSDRRSYLERMASLLPLVTCDCGQRPRGECFGSCYDDPAKGGAFPRLPTTVEAVRQSESYMVDRPIELPERLRDAMRILDENLGREANQGDR